MRLACLILIFNISPAIWALPHAAPAECYDVLNAPRIGTSLQPTAVLRTSAEFHVEINNMNDGYTQFVEGIAIWKDFSQARKKVAIAKKLGFKYNSKTKIFETPTWFEFVHNYYAQMHAAGLKDGEFIRPVMVLAKGPPFPKNGEAKEIILYDPFRDPPPPSEFRVYNNFEGFNLPSQLVNANLRLGRYPLLKSIHDSSHFMAFTRFPWLGKIILQSVKMWPSGEAWPALQRRLFWVLELISLPDTARRNEILRFLKDSGANKIPQSLANIQQRFQRQSDSEFLNYAGSLVRFSYDVIVDLSAAVYGSSEKMQIIDGIFNWDNTTDAFSHSLNGQPALAKVFMLSRFLSEAGHHDYVFYGKEFPTINELVGMNLMIITTALKLVHESLTSLSDQKLADLLAVHFNGNEIGLQYVNQSFDADGVLVNSLKPNARFALLQVAKQFSAILEKSFQSFATEFTMEEFVSALLDPNLDPNEKVAKYLKNTLGANRITNLYLGHGSTER